MGKNMRGVLLVRPPQLSQEMRFLAEAELPDPWAKDMSRFVLDEYKYGVCRAPQIVKLKTGYRTLVPCRNCSPCRENMLRAAIGRSVMQAASNPGSMCATLTYSDATLPSESELFDKEYHYRMRRAFRERAKYHFGPGTKVEMVGQVGTETVRLHWHCLIYPGRPQPQILKRQTFQDGISIWKKGRVVLDGVSPASAAYCKSYLQRDDKGTFIFSPTRHLGIDTFHELMRRRLLRRDLLIRDGSSAYSIGDRVYPMDHKLQGIARAMGVLPPVTPYDQEFMDDVIDQMIRNGGLLGTIHEEKTDKQARDRDEKRRGALAPYDPGTNEYLSALRDAAKGRTRLEDPAAIYKRGKRLRESLKP